MIKKQTRIKALIIPAIFALVFIFTSEAQAEDHYVDCSGTIDGNGTYTSPWNKLPSIKNHTFKTGDDLYFKVNTTCTLKSDSDRLEVNWSGTASDRVIIGAYYGENQFGLNGNARPVISGDANGDSINDYPGSEQGAVNVKTSGLIRQYITIKDLRIEYAGHEIDSGARAITIYEAANINVENCYLYRNRGSLLYGKVNTGLIKNNTVEQSGYPTYSGSGAAIEVSSLDGAPGATTNITVSHNKVFNSKFEGIGLYKRVINSIIEHNVVRDISSFMIYIDAGQYNTIRYNLVYESTDKVAGQAEATYGISVANEDKRGYEWSGYNQIYGNIVAGHKIGISLGCQIQQTYPNEVCHEDTLIYNNTLIDNTYNFRNWRPTLGDNISIKNNLSYINTAGMTHVYTGGNYSGTTWSHNLFYGNALPTGIPAISAVFGDPKLTKASGWRALAPDSISGNHFKLLSASAAINKGTSLASLYNKDYFGTIRPQGTAWDIGAHEYTGSTPAYIPGDLNHDGKVDIADYSMFIQDFGKTGANLAADLNKNGQVEIGDYSIFISNFGKTS